MLAISCICTLLDTEHAALCAASERLVELGASLRAGPDRAPARGMSDDIEHQANALFLGANDSDALDTRKLMRQVLKGKSRYADQRLRALEAEHRRADRLLARALALLRQMRDDDPAAAQELAAALAEHHRALTAALDHEDDALLALGRNLLPDGDWAAIASALSRERPIGLPFTADARNCCRRVPPVERYRCGECRFNCEGRVATRARR